MEAGGDSGRQQVSGRGLLDTSVADEPIERRACVFSEGARNARFCWPLSTHDYRSVQSEVGFDFFR